MSAHLGLLFQLLNPQHRLLKLHLEALRLINCVQEAVIDSFLKFAGAFEHFEDPVAMVTQVSRLAQLLERQRLGAVLQAVQKLGPLFLHFVCQTRVRCLVARVAYLVIAVVTIATSVIVILCEHFLLVWSF